MTGGKSDPFFVPFADENFPRRRALSARRASFVWPTFGYRRRGGRRLARPTDGARRSEGLFNRILLQFYKRDFEKCIPSKAFFDTVQMFRYECFSFLGIFCLVYG